MYNPVYYVRNGKNIIDYSLSFPDNLKIYGDLIIEDMEKIDKKIQNNIIKVNRINRKIFNYIHPTYCEKISKTNYYVSRAYLDGEIQKEQEVYVYCFIDRVEIFPIDWSFIQTLEENKTKLQRYKHLHNKSGVYILKLTNNKYYIGSSLNLYRRLIQHWSQCGSKWTHLYQPMELDTWILTKHEDLLHIENLMTKAYVAKYGSLRVRGGNFYI